MACTVSEKAPEMSAWEAMIVAMVASTARGVTPHSGASR